MNTHVKNAIIAHALSAPTEEVCGLVYYTESETVAHPCANVTRDEVGRSATFEIDPQDYITARGLGVVCGIYHSHVSSAAFSEADIDLARAMALPMFLYSVESGAWSTYVPETYHVNPVSLPFLYGTWDCYETVRTHFRQTRKVYLTDYDRDETFRDAAPDAISRYVEAEGFTYVDRSAPILMDDVLLIKTGNRPHHLAVVVGPNQILHHPFARLSCVEAIDGGWLRRIAAVARYTKGTS